MDLPYRCSSSWLKHLPWLTISERNPVVITTTMRQHFLPPIVPTEDLSDDNQVLWYIYCKRQQASGKSVLLMHVSAHKTHYQTYATFTTPKQYHILHRKASSSPASDNIWDQDKLLIDLL
jgi:hypothetical protein